MAIPIDDIDGKSHKMDEKQQKLFKVKIMPLVIYGFGGIHTHAHTCTCTGTSTHTCLHESDFKKPGAHWPSLALPDRFFPFLFCVGGKRGSGDMVSTSLRSVLIGVKCIVFTIVVRELLVGCMRE